MDLTRVRAIDADGHIGENSAKIWEYLEEPHKEFRQGAARGFGGLTPADGFDRNLGQRLYRGPASKTEDWLAALDRGGMEATVVYPSLGLYYGDIQDPDYQTAFCKAYNTWLANDFCRASNGRIMGVSILPTWYPDEAAKELCRAKELGMVAGMFAADGHFLLGEHQYDQVYQAAAELNMPIAIHASGSNLHGLGTELFRKFIQIHTVAHPFGILRQFTSLMFEGVFEKFPTVRFAFLECGGTWVPWWLDRMDEEFEHRGQVDAPLLKRRPSEYVGQGGNLFFGLEAEERLLGPVLDLLGDDVLMYASDYPHWDGEYPESLFAMQEREDLTENQRHMVLRGAAERFYGLNGR